MIVILATYAAVFIAEIAGDKLLYTTGVLATRYRALPILCGMTTAFMVKMGAAVLVGSTIAKLPPVLVASITAINFFIIAFAIWRKTEKKEAEKEYPSSRAFVISFAAIFFSEWGDVGQMTAVTMAARFGEPLWVWLGAVSAMVTKGAVAASIGASVREWIQEHFSPLMIRCATVSLLIFLGMLAVLETLTEVPQLPD